MFGMASQADLEVMDGFFSEFMDFVTSKSNKFNYDKNSSNTNVNKMLDRGTGENEMMRKNILIKIMIN